MEKTIIFLPFVIMSFVHCISVMPFLAMASTTLSTDGAALLALKARITGYKPHINLLSNNWSASTSPCEWIGTTCSSLSHRVTALNISRMGLSGTLPPDLGNLSFLVSLDMSRNRFHGHLPQELVHLRRLRFISLASNRFTAEIPSLFGLLGNLKYLNLGRNNFTGSLPVSLSNVSKLEYLRLSFNSLEGMIPKELGNLPNLKSLKAETNNFTGPIPATISNISTLEVIAFTQNSLSGSIPIEIFYHLSNLTALYLSFNALGGQILSNSSQGSRLKALSLSGNKFVGSVPREIGKLENLVSIYLGQNNLTGVIPKEIGNLSRLMYLSFPTNELTGSIPAGIFNISSLRELAINDNHLTGNLPANMGSGLRNLEFLNLGGNDLSGVDPSSVSQVPELSFITSLSSCKYLQYLILTGNPLNGVLPHTIGQLSTSLRVFVAYGCKIMGNIPPEISNLSGLVDLFMGDNELTGVIPTTVQGLQNIQRLIFSNNQLQGSIPSSICNIQKLGHLDLNSNHLSGSIPECLDRVASLRFLFLDNNRLTSVIPSSLWNMQDLLQLSLSSNFLIGSLPPEISNLRVVAVLDLSTNNISDTIPSSIGSLQNLVTLSLAQNRLHGPIPSSIGSLLSLEFLDLSQNNLSGVIPKSLEALHYLTYFNVCFNGLNGEIPSGGPFKNFTSESFTSNGALCGSPNFHVPECRSISIQKPRRRKMIQIVVFTVLGIAGLLLALTFAFLIHRSHRQKQMENNVRNQTVELSATPPLRLSYYELLQATDGYGETNLLGVGSFGSVYKGALKDGTLIAIKVFDLQLEYAFKSFVTECDILRNIRHKNIAKVLSCCSKDDFKALVLEYMPNGSLDNWLYSENHSLDMMQRLNIMIDVACALEYLHHGYSLPVVHCDLKPSNVLLDECMVAHVSDFSIAKLLGDGQSIAHTSTLATFGYMAPEYGLEGSVSTRCDIYSLGILLMETFTRRKPNDETFGGDLTLKQWVNDSLPDSIIQIIDAQLLLPRNEYFIKGQVQSVKYIMELALNCSRESPGERINVKNVVVALENIKHQLLACRRQK